MLDVNVALYLTLLKEQSPSWLQSVSKWHNTTYLRHVSVSWLLPCSEKVFKKKKKNSWKNDFVKFPVLLCFVSSYSAYFLLFYNESYMHHSYMFLSCWIDYLWPYLEWMGSLQITFFNAFQGNVTGSLFTVAGRGVSNSIVITELFVFVFKFWLNKN